MEIGEQIISEEIAWKGEIFEVKKLQVKLEDERIARRDIVRNSEAVCVLCVDETHNNQVAMVHQFRPAVNHVTFELPAGKINGDEKPEEAAVREMREETGMRISHLKSLGTIEVSPGFTTERIHLFSALNQAEAGAQQPDPGEFVAVSFVGLADIVEQCVNGEIVDAKTVVTVLRFAAQQN